MEQNFQLYVDYAVFIIGDPGKTLKVLIEMLIAFGAVSGFKVNESKSIILRLNINTELKRKVQEFDSSVWSNKVKYLGISFTFPMTNEQLIKIKLKSFSD